ncbi:MAG: 3-dehydroquinate synthase [Pirellulales bacterium]|nr:3-dehydroquinate synthase [Pirellulales bacterium]
MSTQLKIVRVALAERAYDIQIGAGTLATADQFVARHASARHVVIVTDRNVAAPYAAAVAGSLRTAGLKVNLEALEPGEATKSIATAERLWNRLLALGADRRTLVVAVGGGVIGDVAGFAAATFARGLAFVQVPTTLLAQVDSSVGGKVGINLPGAKNMVGAFWQPRGVLVDTAVLESLPASEYRAGLAEVVKYGVALDSHFFDWLERHAAELNARDAATLTHVVERSCRLKADVVEADERELTGRRAVLNYGHTFAHAIEAVSEYSGWLHGEAVAVGMHCAARLAERLGRIDAEVVRRQRELLVALGLPIELPPLGAERLLAAMARDKKVEAGKLRFVLPNRLGHAELVEDVPTSEVEAVLANIGK